MPEQWRKWPLFDNIFRLSGVPVITVQLRYNGWVTEMQDPAHMQNLSQVRGGLVGTNLGSIIQHVSLRCILRRSELFVYTPGNTKRCT